jgi:hypothetical protein
MAQLHPVLREPVDRGKHFGEDALRAECLIVGKLPNVDTLLLRAQERSPEQFISNGGVGRIH